MTEKDAQPIILPLIAARAALDAAIDALADTVTDDDGTPLLRGGTPSKHLLVPMWGELPEALGFAVREHAPDDGTYPQLN